VKASKIRGFQPHEHKEAFVPHRNARLTPRGRQILVERVRFEGMPVAHAAKAMGVSRQCAHRWVRRFDQEGVAGLEDRSSRPHRSPRATSTRRVERVLRARRTERCGPAELARLTGVPERTVTRILRRHGVPRLPECDPMTGEVIRASRSTSLRYERARPGELVHVDVKKLGRIPSGGGWRANGRGPRPGSKRGPGYDYVHSMVDDHSRLAYSEVLADERGSTCAAFVLRATAAFAEAGISRIEAVMSDNAKNYTLSGDFQAALLAIGARHVLIRPHCPWQNGKVERLNRTLQVEWAYRRVYRTNALRTRALATWLRRYNTQRPHSALGGRPPISRLS
jgi:transposase InsO family protein